MDRKAFYAALRKDKRVFGTSLSQNQVDGIEGILDASISHSDGTAKVLAYALATAYHETGRYMLPIKETVQAYHRDKNPSDATVVRRLDEWAQKNGRTTNIYWRPDANGFAAFGRGHVQLTWDYNYKGSSKDAGVDLMENPEAMLDPVISARVLFKGLLDGRWNAKGKGIRSYLDRNDLKNARRTVNITDEWDKIAQYYRAFMHAIEAAGGVPKLKAPIAEPKPAPIAPEQPTVTPPEAPAPKGWSSVAKALALLIGALAAAFGADQIDIINQVREFLP